MASPAIGTGTGNSKTPIGDQLAALYPDRSGSRRARFKAAALADRLGTRTFQVAGCVGGRTVTVSNIHVDELGALVCTITHPDIPAEANPFRFVNPPIRVPDGTTRVEVDPRTGENRTVTNFEENALAAGRQMIRDVVAVVIK